MDGVFIIAVHALVYLGHVEDFVSSEQLAKNICANPARIRKVLSQLRNKGFIETKEGKLGGYKISKNPATITLKDIACALNSSFAKPTWKSEEFDEKCLISTHIRDVMDTLGQEMDSLLYKFLESISVKEIENQILSKDWSSEASGATEANKASGATEAEKATKANEPKKATKANKPKKATEPALATAQRKEVKNETKQRSTDLEGKK